MLTHPALARSAAIFRLSASCCGDRARLDAASAFIPGRSSVEWSKSKRRTLIFKLPPATRISAYEREYEKGITLTNFLIVRVLEARVRSMVDHPQKLRVRLQ